MRTTSTVDDDFEPVERIHVPTDNNGTSDADDEWTTTESSILDPNNAMTSPRNNTAMQQRHPPSPSITKRDDDENFGVGVPGNVVVVELLPSMSTNTTNEVGSSCSNNLEVMEFIKNGGDFDDTESLGMASRATVTSSVLHQFELLNTKGEYSVTDIPTVVVHHNGTTEDLERPVKQPTICDVTNSDRRSCSTSTSSSNNWSIVEEQQRYLESGQ